eukprot:485005_1
MGNIFESEAVIKRNDELITMTNASILAIYQNLINGYIGLKDKKYKEMELSTIINVIKIFIGNVFIKFNVCHEKYDSSLKKYGTLFHRNQKQYMEHMFTIKTYPSIKVYHPKSFIIASAYGFG